MSTPLAPVNDLQAVPALVEAGAHELYMGFYDPEWYSAFGQYADVNRTSGFSFNANAYSLADVLQAIPQIKATGAKLYITFNAASYSAWHLPYFRSYFQQLAEAGADGVILSGPELVSMALEYGLEPVASTMCGIYNTQLADLYAQLGARRIILPRDLSLEEMQAITAAYPELDYEVFLMRNGCIFSDSHCLGMHGMGRGALCGELRGAYRETYGTLQSAEENTDRYCRRFHSFACGLCALWDLEQMGVDAYKVVGRMDDPVDLTLDIGLVARNLEVARQCSTRAEYLQNMEHHPFEEQVCTDSLNCYYPEIWPDASKRYCRE